MYNYQTPLQKAQDVKSKGNKYFKAGRYEQAIECYTLAISQCPPDEYAEISTFYQNRAAAYELQVNVSLYLFLQIDFDITKLLTFMSYSINPLQLFLNIFDTLWNLGYQRRKFKIKLNVLFGMHKNVYTHISHI